MRLIAIDLDGTLLSADGTISSANKEAILDVQRKGNIVIISSGRSFHDTKQILQNADLKCPIIIGNGALSFHSNSLIQRLTLSINILQDLLVMLEKSNLYYEIYTNKGILLKQNGKEILNKEIQNLQFDTDWARDLVDIQYKQHGLIFVKNYLDTDFSNLDPYKIFVFSFDGGKLSRLEKILSHRKDISITTSGSQKLEIGNVNANKGNGLKIMANYFGIPLENTVAIGDNLNDLSMFETAGISIAMGNAEDVVKEKATYITKRYDDDGVAYALRCYVY
ncbi:Cof-type HAD-IIB family hydrolase [Oceanobacillus profundus]|uniref:HAD family phosphatase n=1 Tax=Oceanobacillus profundus TaxID=372463 RepID=A0A417YPC3_9BACI|nr:Cof-type HAD-IIB family hydrolase [Oceanobacillus profundus]RHW35547.1 HAD family phosphatase [Oceanobacillus profundus]